MKPWAKNCNRNVFTLPGGGSSGFLLPIENLQRFFKDKAVRQRPGDFQKQDARKKVVKLLTENKKEDGKQETAFCQECRQAFISEKPGQKYCCKTHKDTYRKRLLRENRKAEGKCPQCGKPMAEAADGTYKEKLSYCQHCRDYWIKDMRRKRQRHPAEAGFFS